MGKSTALCIADLSDPATPQKIVDSAITAFGKIDAVVNNAAFIERNNLSQLTPEAFTKTITINLQSALFLIQAAFPHLKKTAGCVLNIGSINAYSGESSLLAYSIGKAGLQTMTRNLANAHGTDKVRFNLINPCLLYTSPSPRDRTRSRMPSSA